MQTAPPAVRLTAVDKSFAVGDTTTPVLKQVDFEARRGEMIFLVGPSGCGKTTLLSILCGTLDADAGEIDVLGHRLRAMTSGQVTRFRADNVGFIFQQFNLIPVLTIAENVAAPLLIKRQPMAAALEKARRALERVGLGDKTEQRPGRLSGGQQQRVAIARALVHEPPLVICDEPTSALDSQTGQQVMELLRDVARDPQRAVIIVTHDHRIYRFADRLAEMEDGRILRVLQSPTEIAAAHPELRP